MSTDTTSFKEILDKMLLTHEECRKYLCLYIYFKNITIDDLYFLHINNKLNEPQVAQDAILLKLFFLKLEEYFKIKTKYML
jgi:hypothetical protein